MAKTLLVIAGPSAVGKTYLAQQLINSYKNQFEMGKLFTTRKPRPAEVMGDRIYISNKKFESMKQNRDFIISGNFSGNKYGYTPDVLKPKDKHIIVNAWPALIPQFLSLPESKVIGLNVKLPKIGLLESRMRARGDSDETISLRLEFIKRDISDLEVHRQTVEEYGKFFYIADDNTIGSDVLPRIVAEVIQLSP